MQIAIQGEPGSFSHEATLGFFPQATIVPCSFSPEVFRLVTDGQVEAAVIPIENSLAGSVLEHYDLLLQNDLLVEQEALLRIRHNLIAVPGSDISKVRRVYSHPIALAQCRRFFADHPEMEAVPFYDTAGSVKQAMELRDPSIAGLASTQAAIQYGAQVLAAGIEDNAENFTRFFVLRRSELVRANSEANKVSVAFTVENRPGTLIEALQTFAGLGTNLTKIESRPVQGKPWEYVFYADYQVSDPDTADAAIRLLTVQCSMVKELGRYKAAERS